MSFHLFPAPRPDWPPAPVTNTELETAKNGVQKWMTRHSGDYENVTQLTEAAAAEFKIYNRDGSIPQWVFERATIATAH